jgi:hypothetical protein
MIKDVAILAIIMVFALGNTLGGSNQFGLLMWIVFMVRLRSLLTKVMANPHLPKLPCPQCGTLCDDEASYCSSCGTELPRNGDHGHRRTQEARVRIMRTVTGICIAALAVTLLYSMTAVSRDFRRNRSSVMTSADYHTSATSTRSATVTTAAQNISISLSGNGDSVLTGVQAAADAFLSIKYGGKGNFSVWAHCSDGSKSLLVNEIGTYNGLVYLGDAGTYTLEINADDSWTIDGGNIMTTSQTSFSGKGDFVTPWFAVPGQTWYISHDGESNFAVRQHDPYNNWDLLVNEIGSYSGTILSDVDAALGFFEIKADGNWEIKPR